MRPALTQPGEFHRGGQFMMDDASIKAISMSGPGGGIDASNSSPKISITAETVALSNGALITADSHGTAAACDITLNVDVLTTQAGENRLPLNPTNNFNFVGNFIASDSRSTDAGGGPAGKITIQGVGGPGTAATSVPKIRRSAAGYSAERRRRLPRRSPLPPILWC